MSPEVYAQTGSLLKWLLTAAWLLPLAGFLVEIFGQTEFTICATWCGRALALSHARSGCSAVLSGYMGKSDIYDQAIADFSIAYADQNESDHAALDRAVRVGKVAAVFEEDR